MKTFSPAAATHSPRIAWTKRCTAAVAVLAIAAVACSSAAGAALQPIDLQVEEGGENWHAEPIFGLRWSNPPQAVAAVHYRLLDRSGQEVVGETTLPWPATAIQHLRVPPTPGPYTVLVWLEDSSGAQGAPVAATLRFDDAAPGDVELVVAEAWIGRNDFPYAIHVGRPEGPEPLSGIRGYAVSIDASPAGLPCLDAYTCSDQETDLRGGVAANSLPLGGLSEGISYAHAFAVSGSGAHSRMPSTAVLRVDKTDPVTRLSGLPDGWSDDPVKLTASAVDADSGMVATGGRNPYTAIRVGASAPVIAAGDSVVTTVIGSGVHPVAYYARDAAGNANDGVLVDGRANPAPTRAVVRIDPDDPRLSFAAAQDPADPERIEVRISDALSGIDSAKGSIAVRLAGAAERFRPLPTEVSDDRLRSRWDSDAYPPGEYEFRALAYDLAGNSATTLDRSGGTPMRLHSPLKVATTLVADLGERGRWFRGRLFAGRRAPLAGVSVQVTERFDVGADPRERVSTVRTDGDGAFAMRLRRGPSRQVSAATAATATLRGANSEPLRLAVRGDVRMRASSAVARVGGRPIVFRGRVSAPRARIPSDGKVVQLQFRLPGGLEWSEFRTLRTDERGRFRYAYRFADDDSRGVRFQFRAYAPGEAGWPFEPAGSRPVAVLGR